MTKILALATLAAAGAVAFAQPAAAQSTAPACVAGPFMVFFDARSFKITPQGAAILDNAAASYATCGDAAVEIAGHTDRKGTDKANLALSRRIAASVRAYMIKRGIPAKRITTHAFGESRPLVETADGVSEPQNRRAEIIYSAGSGW